MMKKINAFKFECYKYNNKFRVAIIMVIEWSWTEYWTVWHLLLFLVDSCVFRRNNFFGPSALVLFLHELRPRYIVLTLRNRKCQWQLRLTYWFTNCKNSIQVISCTRNEWIITAIMSTFGCRGIGSFLRPPELLMSCNISSNAVKLCVLYSRAKASVKNKWMGIMRQTTIPILVCLRLRESCTTRATDFTLGHYQKYPKPNQFKNSFSKFFFLESNSGSLYRGCQIRNIYRHFWWWVHQAIVSKRFATKLYNDVKLYFSLWWHNNSNMIEID